MNYFVTGSTGFIGKFLLERLLEREDAKVFVLIRESSAEKFAHMKERYGDLSKKLHMVPGDVTNPGLVSAADFKKLPSLGYGLTDVNKTEFGMDTQLTDGDDPDELRRKIVKYKPRILAFTAKRPAMVVLARKKVEYGFQDETIGTTRLYVLPSPSGRAGSFWDIEKWRELADAVKAEDAR